MAAFKVRFKARTVFPILGGGDDHEIGFLKPAGQLVEFAEPGRNAIQKSASGHWLTMPGQPSASSTVNRL
jgi:hypothetical protein